MEFLVFFIFLILAGYSYVKKNADTPEMRQKKYNQQVGGSYVSSYEPNNNYVSSVNRQAAMRTVMTTEQRQKLEAYKQKKAGYSHTYSAPVQKAPESIVEQAKNNIEELKQEKVQELLAQEQMLGSELLEIDTSSSLGDVNDLIVKGYDGNIEFERDFIAEAMDMLNSYTMCSTHGDW